MTERAPAPCATRHARWPMHVGAVLIHDVTWEMCPVPRQSVLLTMMTTLDVFRSVTDVLFARKGEKLQQRPSLHLL